MQQRTAAPSSAYESDFAQWAETQATALRQGRFADLDLANLTEEIDDLSNRKRDIVRSRFKQIAAHLLKLQYQPERATSSLETTIRIAADKIEDVLEGSPSLRREMPDSIATGYRRGRKSASIETDLPIATFPDVPTPEFERALGAALAGNDFGF